jgi:hypothetical protein
VDISHTDKALEAAAEVLAKVNPYAFKDHLKAPADYAHPNPTAINVAKQILTAYHAALEGQGENEIAEIRGRHIVREHELQAMQTQAFPLLLQTDKAHADRATLLERERADGHERLRALQYAFNSFIEAVKPLVDEERGNG